MVCCSGVQRAILHDFSAYIFDLDGTIVDSAPTVLDSLCIACGQAGIDLSDGIVTSELIGPPVAEIIRRIMPSVSDMQLNVAVAAFRETYDNNTHERTSIYPRMDTLLDILKQGGKKLYIATNKPCYPTRVILQKLALPPFDDVYTIDRHPDRKMSKTEMLSEIIEKDGLQKDQTIMFGDTLNDIQAAHNVGISAVGVLWGYEKEKESLEISAEYVFRTVEDILK